MSSILKALKRVEAESPSPQPYQSLSRPIDAEQVLNSNIRKRWQSRRFVYLLLFLAVVGGGVAVVFSQRELLSARFTFLLPSDSPAGEAADAKQPGVYRAKIPTASARTAPRPNKTGRIPAMQAKRTTPAVRDKKIQPRTLTDTRQRTDRIETATRKGDSSPMPRTARSATAQKSPKRVSAPPKTDFPKRTAAKRDPQTTGPAAKIPKPVRPQPRQTYARITDDQLKLQAVAWANEAARRLAVINDRIVHEGESVDGYQIVKIRQEDVILKRGGKSWRLEFGLRQ